ncbi:glycoside hydrolase family 97 catalytic domain-containing protein [Haloarcula onubensis]|uniref:Glycoside hydrolase family 97 catalytic domain-containing protein n=1 Tax=Haloarcula onubensis TaxID=2950539 RepID=A0ABU2FNX7_9EURY|nr:glycoside hydrolase family 97 catalytic domain-containing protein [Halomicroarcula sp. S3CR25-11]MDS0282459.1 glycoside hydrolase family 97 catalytic domain-containing protein [Halomicroarcula sp. S3CR25-11]
MTDDNRSCGSRSDHCRPDGGTKTLLTAAAFSREVSPATAAAVTTGNDSPRQRVRSPDGRIAVTVDVTDGVPTYSVAVAETTYVEPSGIGFDFRNQPAFGASHEAAPEVRVTGAERGSGTESWEPVVDQYDRVNATYRSLRLGLAETADPGRAATLELRVFDDGFGFRTVFSTDFGHEDGQFVLTGENTAFDFAEDYDCWWIENRFSQPEGEPGRFEDEYRETPLSELPSGRRSQLPGGAGTRRGVHTPLTIDAGELYLSVHEAALTDYATLSLAPDGDGATTLSAELAPLPDGTKVSARAPHVTPWRTVQVGDSPGDLLESSLVPLLNDDVDESALPASAEGPDTDWITPKKYVGIWWMMIAGAANWQYRSDADLAADDIDPGKYIHGARTERMKRYLQFASDNGVDSVLAEGWNEGWEDFPGPAGDALDFSVDGSTPDFDLAGVTAFGQSLSPAVEMTMHNETAGNVVNYEAQLADDIFGDYEAEAIRSVKTGYVSDPGLGFEDNAEPTHNHHCQLAVNHQELVARRGGASRQLLERHESDKPTGKRRTYPHLAASEVLKAQEYDGFGRLGSDVGEGHHVTLPFTRMLAGPISYQPGLFDIRLDGTASGRVRTTRAKQLAMYPTYNAGMQMLADRIEAYVSPEFEVGQLLQAQSGALDGLVTADTWRNAFGAHYVPMDPNRAEPGASVSFTVRDVPSAGEYDLHLRYASDGDANTPRVRHNGGPQATLRVDGETTTIAPDYTGYWDQWEVFTTTVSLSAGDNTVALELQYDDEGSQFRGDVGGFNLDAVAVTEVGEPSPVPAEYEGYTPEAENFETLPAFDFLEAVPAGGWDDTRVVDAEIGDYSVVARRAGEEWFLGAMTDECRRVLDVPLDFLGPDDADAGGPSLVAEIYTDGVGASAADTADEVHISRALVDHETALVASMARTGGTAVRIRPANAGELQDLPEYERPTGAFDASIDAEQAVGAPLAAVTGRNDTDTVGGATLELLVDGEVVESRTVRLPAGATDAPVRFEGGVETPGEYDVTVRRGDGTVLASETVSVSHR